MALEIFALQVLLAFAITAFGVMAAARIKQMQSFMAPTQMLVTPMFFWRVPTLVERRGRAAGTRHAGIAVWEFSRAE
jgi:hypothetical protein